MSVCVCVCDCVSVYIQIAYMVASSNIHQRWSCKWIQGNYSYLINNLYMAVFHSTETWLDMHLHIFAADRKMLGPSVSLMKGISNVKD